MGGMVWIFERNSPFAATIAVDYWEGLSPLTQTLNILVLL